MTPDMEGKYHRNIVAINLEITLNDLYKDIFYKNVSDLDHWARTFENVAVQYDSTRDLYYSTLPRSIVQLPERRGIRRISPMQSPEITFKPMGDNQKSMFMNLDVAEFGTDCWFSFDSDRVEYYNLPPDVTDVLMKLLIPFSEHADTDEFTIPSGFNDYVIETVVGKLLGMPPEKDSNNNNSSRLWTQKR